MWFCSGFVLYYITYKITKISHNIDLMTVFFFCVNLNLLQSYFVCVFFSSWELSKANGYLSALHLNHKLIPDQVLSSEMRSKHGRCFCNQIVCKNQIPLPLSDTLWSLIGFGWRLPGNKTTPSPE